MCLLGLRKFHVETVQVIGPLSQRWQGAQPVLEPSSRLVDFEPWGAQVAETFPCGGAIRDSSTSELELLAVAEAFVLVHALDGHLLEDIAMSPSHELWVTCR